AGTTRHRPAHPCLPTRRQPGQRAGRRLCARPRDRRRARHELHSLNAPDSDVMNAATPTTNPARKRLLLIATGVFLLIAIAYGIWWALFGAHFESTDDAYVHGNLVQITPQVPGTV